MYGFSFIFCLLFGFCYCASTFSYTNATIQATEKEIKGTLFENGGLECDESCIDKYLEDASSYTKLYLFLRDSKQNYTEIIYQNLTSFDDSGFDVSKKTKLLVHGWMEYAFDGFATDLRDSYFAADEDDVNVLSVDWSKVADLLYPLARLFVVPVGKFMAKYVDWLVTDAGVSIDSLHIIGLSLGGQVAGAIGEHITSGQIGRITGLDPAGPGFSTSKSGRLDSSDAKFVDVIHTCGHWAGYYGACGHIDFYPNKGMYNQPGCSVDLGVCSHKRSYHYFNESISSEKFVATKCDSWKNFVAGKCVNNNVAIMGEHVDTSAKGKFYLYTAGSYPYALGDERTELYDNEEL